MGLTGLSGEKIAIENRFVPARAETQGLPVIAMRPHSGLTKKGLKLVWATLISLAYGSGNEEEDLDPRDLYSAYITWMSTSIVGLTQNGLDEALRERDIKVEITWVNGATELIDAVTERFPGVVDILQSIYDDGRSNSDDVFAIAAVLLQTIGRKPTELSVSKWWAARLKSASQTVGGSAPRTKWEDAPPLKRLEQFNGYMSKAFHFRKMVFEAIVSKSTDGTLIGKVCRHVLGLLAWAECAYIPAIDKYLIGNYVELLNLKQLAGEEEALGRMLQFIDACGDKAKYVKFYVRHEDCRPIHREQVTKSVIVAAMIAEITEPSYANFYIDRTCKFYLMMKEILKEYIELRKLPDMLTMAEDPSARMSTPAFSQFCIAANKKLSELTEADGPLSEPSY